MLSVGALGKCLSNNFLQYTLQMHVLLLFEGARYK